MTRLTKIAILNIAAAALSMLVFCVMYLLIGRGAAMVGAFVACVVVVPAGIFKRPKPLWDELELKILNQGQVAGYALFWFFVMMQTFLLMNPFMSDPILKPSSTILASTMAWYLIAGLWMLGLGQGLFILWVQRDETRLMGSGNKPPFYFGLVPMALLLPVVMGGIMLATPEMSWLSKSKGFAGSVEIDEWRIVAGGTVEASSRITLDRWPNDASKIVISLPYEDGELTAVMFGGKEGRFERLKPGKYKVMLPIPYDGERDRNDSSCSIYPPWPVDPELVVEWTVPLGSLETSGDESNPYRVRLRSLIPTHNYALTVIADEDSGFKMIRDAKRDESDAIFRGRTVWWDRLEVFSVVRGDGGYDSDWGTCSMLITPAGDRGPLVPVTCLPGTSRELADQIARSVRRIDDYPREDAWDIPAVYVLINIGEPAIPAVLDLMLSDEESTRWRAETILWKITRSMCGLGDNQSWPAEREAERIEKKAQWEALWERLGPLDHDGSQADRERAVRLWREWLSERASAGETD